MKIYTKTGDNGETSTFGGKRISKSNIRIKTNGTIDELNSAIGIITSTIEYGLIKEKLIRIQHELFDAGADVSTSIKDYKVLQLKEKYKINEEHINRLEMEIDEMDSDLPPLKNFILPGGSIESSYVHLARSICRRAERDIVAMLHVEKSNPYLLSYLNRLSDWLFILARYINKIKNFPEVKYNPKNDTKN